MKRFTLALAILTFIAATLPAQLLHDPYDPIYKDFDVWATKEYLQVLPPVRPYPIQLAQDLLRTVVQKGDSESSKQAARYLAALERGSVHGSVQAGLVGENDDITPQSAFSGYAWFSPESWLSGSLSFDAWAVKRSVGTEIRVPGIYSPYPDMINDTSNIGSFQILQNWNSIVSLGSRKVYFQAGLNRGSFGPFFENGVVLGPQAGHAGHFSAVYLGQGWKASMVHLALAATNQFGTDRLPDKHLVLHSFDFMVLPDVEIGAFEAVIYGDRLDLLYMAPFNFLFQAQGVKIGRAHV